MTSCTELQTRPFTLDETTAVSIKRHTHAHTLPTYRQIQHARRHPPPPTRSVPPLPSDHPPPPHPFPGLCYCFENMIAVTDGVGRGEGSGRAEWQGSSIVPDQCESVSIAIETGATLGRHAFISATGSPLAIRGQINPPFPLRAPPDWMQGGGVSGWAGGGDCRWIVWAHAFLLSHTHAHAYTGSMLT